MAARKPATVPVSEFVSREDAERMAQEAAGRVLMTMPEPEPETPSEPDPEDIALANVLSELGSSNTEAKVNIYQFDGQKNRAFIGAMLPAEFSMEKIQADFGPGDYEVRVYSTGGLLTRKVIKIAAPKLPANALPVSAPALETGKIIETMQSGFEKMATMFAGALQNMTANQPKPKTTMEMLQEMQLMREIMGGNAPAAPGPDPMRLFEMATEIADKIQPRQGEPGAGEVILNAIKQFGPVLAQAAANRPQPVITQPALPSPPVLNPVTPVAPSTEPESDQMSIARKMYLNMLIANAHADNDPATYAQLMIDLVGDEAAIQFANAPDWFEQLCAEEPRAANFRKWFEELRLVVLELTKPEVPDMNTGDENKPEPV
jgi:hypothetical protein